MHRWSMLVVLVSAMLCAAADQPTPQNVLAANRQGLIDYCDTFHSLDGDPQALEDALGRRRHGAGGAGDTAHELGEQGRVLQNGTPIEIDVLGVQINRPPRWFCDQVADEAMKPDPLPEAFQ